MKFTFSKIGVNKLARPIGPFKFCATQHFICIKNGFFKPYLKNFSKPWKEISIVFFKTMERNFHCSFSKTLERNFYCTFKKPFSKTFGRNFHCALFQKKKPLEEIVIIFEKNSKIFSKKKMFQRNRT